MTSSIPTDPKQLADYFVAMKKESNEDAIASVLRVIEMGLQTDAHIHFTNEEVVLEMATALKNTQNPQNIERATLIIGNIIAKKSNVGQTLPTTSVIYNAILVAFTHAKTANTVENICFAVGTLVANNPQGQELFATPAFYNAVVACFEYARTADSVQWLCLAIGNIARNNPTGQKLFTTPEIYIAIVACFEFATTADSVENVCYAIGHIAYNNPNGQKMFSTLTVSKIIVSSFELAKTPSGVHYVSAAVGNITANNHDGQKLFSTDEMYNSVVTAFKSATTPESYQHVCYAIASITASQHGQKLFSTPAIYKAIVTAFKYAVAGVDIVCIIIGNIANNADGKKLFATDVVRDWFMSIFERIVAIMHEPQTPRVLSIFVETLSRLVVLSDPDALKVFSTKEFLRTLKTLGAEVAHLKPSHLDEKLGKIISAIEEHLNKKDNTKQEENSRIVASTVLLSNDATSVSANDVLVAQQHNTAKILKEFNEKSSKNRALLESIQTQMNRVCSKVDSTVPSSAAASSNVTMKSGKRVDREISNEDIYGFLQDSLMGKLDELENTKTEARETLLRNCAWILALAASYGYKIDDADLEILVEKNVDHKKFLRLDEAQMTIFKFSGNAQLIFSKIIQAEKMSRIKRGLPIIKQSQVQIGKPLGAGATCTVYEAIFEGAPVAAKMFSLLLTDESSFQREIKTSANLRHPNIVNVSGVIVDDVDPNKIVGILMEKMSNENLAHKMKKQQTVQQVLKWCHQAACGILSAHNRGTIHSDIKPENILISESGIAKLTDFGSAFALSTIQTAITEARGTAQYIAPEYANPELLKEDFKDCGFSTVPNTSTDVFSFGMTLWSVFHPDVDHDLGKINSQILISLQRGKRPLITATNIPDEVKSLIERCWKSNPGERPTVQEIVKVLDPMKSLPVVSVGIKSNNKITNTAATEESSSKKTQGCPTPCVVQ